MLITIYASNQSKKLFSLTSFCARVSSSSCLFDIYFFVAQLTTFSFSQFSLAGPCKKGYSARYPKISYN